MKPTRISGILFIIAILMSCNGCESPKSAMMLPPDPPTSNTPVFLAAGDVIKLSFPGNPEYNQTQKIRPDGKISLPLIGEVQAAGQNIPQLQTQLSSLLASQLQNSEVVIALDITASPVYVSGAVLKPGKVEINGPMTALEAIMEAGGFIEGTSDTKKVKLIRMENGHYTTHILDLSPSLRGQTATALLLKPRDVIYVPQSIF